MSFRPMSGVDRDRDTLNPLTDSIRLTRTGRGETLQDKMILDDQTMGERKLATRKELSSKLPELPNEAAIQKELRDEEELLHLYKEIEEKKREAVTKRKDIAYKKIEKLEEEKRERLKRLK